MQITISNIFLIHRQDDKCNGAEDWKASQVRDDDEEALKIEATEEEEKEEPVRRSSRRQDPASNIVEMHSTSTISESVSSKVLNDALKLHVRRSSRSKHHKNKTKHHKDKRKKRRHTKNGTENGGSVGLNGSENTNENTLDVQNCTSLENKDLDNCETTVVSELDTKLKLDVSFGINTKDVESVTTKTEHIDSVRFINDVNNTTNNNAGCDARAIDASSESARDTLEDDRITKLNFNDAAASSSLPKHECKAEDLNEDVEYLLNPVSNINDRHVETQATDAPEKTSKPQNKTNSTHYAESQEYEEATFYDASQKDDESKDAEDRKQKRKRKRLRHDEQAGKNSAKDTSENNASDETAASSFKHRRKKHKHTNEHKTKKHHDVRKAPQDGIVQEETQDACTPEVEVPSSTVGSGKIADNIDSVISEPQRLAIKIKLCQECEVPHLQDVCPFTEPLHTIIDAISYEEWLSKHKENAEVTKAVKSKDPMSEGYGRLADDGFESDDEPLASSEQCKTKSKVQREEKQLLVDADRPLYARDSLPDCLELKIANTDHGLSIYAKNPIPIRAKLGPLVGTSVKEMDIPDDFSMRHIWEVLSLFRFD